MPRPTSQQSSPTRRCRRPTAYHTRPSKNSTPPTASSPKAKSHSRGPVAPIIIQGNANDLFALNHHVRRDVRDFVTDRIEEVEKEGHELIEPTARKFVFILQLQKPGEEFILTEEAREALEEYISADDELEMEQIKKTSAKPINKPKVETPLAPTREAAEPSSPPPSTGEQAKSPALTAHSSHNITTTHEDTARLVALDKDTQKRLRIPRTSDGPSLASLIALAQPSDFEPEFPSSRPTLSKPVPNIGLRHISELPSLAALIASADAGDFPIPESESESDSEETDQKLDPDAYTGVVDVTGAQIVNGAGTGAKEQLEKKHSSKEESWLRMEVMFDKVDEERDGTEGRIRKFRVRRRERGAWWLEAGVDSSLVLNTSKEVDQAGLDRDAITPVELTTPALETQTSKTTTRTPSSRIIHIRYVSMNDVWGEILSLSTKDSTVVSNSSTEKTTSTAATQYSQLIEALDLSGWPARKTDTAGCDFEVRSVGEGLEEKAASLKSGCGEDQGQLLESQDIEQPNLAVEVETGKKKDRKISRRARMLGTVKGKVKRMGGRVVESIGEVARKLRTAFGRG